MALPNNIVKKGHVGKSPFDGPEISKSISYVSASGQSVSGRRYNSALRWNKLKYKEKGEKRKEAGAK